MHALTMKELQRFEVPARSLAVWWLGQMSFILKSPAGKIMAIDPYLSNSCRQAAMEGGFDMDRQTPPPMAASDLVGIDLYLLTHSHQDHLDPDTLRPYLQAGGRGPFVAPAETVEKLCHHGVHASAIEMTWPNHCTLVGDLTIRATFAIPYSGDDLTHVGYLVGVAGGPVFYFTGDTAYHEILGVAAGPHRPDVLVAVINGGFRNMGPYEAARLAKELDVKRVIPCHHDLFHDNMVPPQMLRTNLMMYGIGDRYCLLEHAKPFVYTCEHL